MKKQKKQNLLNAIIAILVIALIGMIISIIYEEKINMSKQPIQDTNTSVVDNEYIKEEKTEIEEEITDTDDNENEEVEEELPKEENEYIGEEESNIDKQPEMTTDEKVIALVKKEWGNDKSVNVTIEKKNGTKYRAAVRDTSTTVLQWYEIDIETWEISEY